MKGFFAIFQRELNSLFFSPVAYVFTFIFLVLAAVFTFHVGGLTYFVRNEAALHAFFQWHPVIYLVLVPAIGMHLWSEERRSGTIELLFTMPITPEAAVLAKFFAAWLFLLGTLVLTFPMVVITYYLGEPDLGLILTGYLGSFLLCGVYLAITSMTSTFSRSQVVSFIIAEMLCFASIFFGFDGIQQTLRDWQFMDVIINQLNYFSVSYHFQQLQRGIVDFKDLLYFATMIAVPLTITVRTLKSHRAG